MSVCLTRQDVQQSIINTRSARKRAYAYATAAAVVSTAGVAQADFTGDYAPANWTTITGSPDANVANDGMTAVLTGSDAGALDVLEYQVTVAATGTFSFDWSYTNLLGDLGSYDYAGILNGGNFTLLATNQDAFPGPSVGGSTTVDVTVGDSFSFVVVTLDGLLGAGELTINNFNATVIPEPSALGLLAVGTIGGILAGRRRRD